MEKQLEYWLKHIESFHPAEIELGLQRIRMVAERLDLLAQSSKVVIVGGTNGKGSCVAMLESLAIVNGLKVACYTSPHLLKFNERIRIDGRDTNDSDLIAAFEHIESAREDLALTFFEFTTLAALWIFKKSAPDIIILEVGLGGRLDAVNIIEPDISIITTIDIDHIDWLGDSLQKIAFEKSGIAREGKTTLVGDEQSLNLLRALPHAKQIDYRLVVEASTSQKASILDLNINPHRLISQNLMLAYQAFKMLFENANFFTKALSQISLRGRFQFVDSARTTIVDVAHNKQAATNLSMQLKALRAEAKYTRVIAICGMMADKALADVLQIIDPQVDQWCFVDLPIARAISGDKLLELYQQLKLNKQAAAYPSVAEAYRTINFDSESNPLILVFGSFITVANMLQYAQSFK